MAFLKCPAISVKCNRKEREGEISFVNNSASLYDSAQRRPYSQVTIKELQNAPTGRKGGNMDKKKWLDRLRRLWETWLRRMKGIGLPLRPAVRLHLSKESLLRLLIIAGSSLAALAAATLGAYFLWEKPPELAAGNPVLTEIAQTQESAVPTDAPTPTPDPSVTTAPPGGGTYTAYVNTANKKALNARKGNSENYSVKFKIPYGAAVTVLKHGTKWDYVQYNGKKGYVNNKFLWTTKPADAPAVTEAPAPAPAPAVYPRAGKIWAANGKSVNVHKQAGDWSSNVDGIGRLDVGTSVTILSASGGWTKIEYNGHQGYVHSEFVQ